MFGSYSDSNQQILDSLFSTGPALHPGWCDGVGPWECARWGEAIIRQFLLRMWAELDQTQSPRRPQQQQHADLFFVRHRNTEPRAEVTL